MKKKLACLLAVTMLAAVIPQTAFATEVVEDGFTDDGEEAGEEIEETEPETEPETFEDPAAMMEDAFTVSTLSREAVIADGVYIDTTYVGGMTADEAMAAVLAEIEELKQKTITLSLEDASGVDPIVVTVGELGLHSEGLANSVMDALALGKSGNLIVRYKAKKDLEATNKIYELDLAIGEQATSQFLDAKVEELAIEPVNAEISFDGSRFTVTDSQTGIEMDKEATYNTIMDALSTWNHEDLSLTATAEISEPERTTEALSKIQDKIGTFSTGTGSASEGKKVNLRRGVALTTGTLIMPGETWSMHDALAPFSAENGYTQQIAYQNGGYVQEYGGGICQLATTLYNAALLAEVHITERHNHSMTVGYTYPGLDATINDGGSKDLELTNDFDFPIYIYATVGGSVTYSIYGVETRPSNRTLKFYGEYTSYVDSGESVTIDNSLAPGQVVVDQATSYPTATAVAYKEIYVDGVLQERITLHTDKYRGSPRKVRRGPDAPAPTQPAETQPAETQPAETQPAETQAPVPETQAPVPETQAPAPETQAPAPETQAPAEEQPQG